MNKYVATNLSGVSHTIRLKTSNGKKSIYMRPGQSIDITALGVVVDKSVENYFNQLKSLKIALITKIDEDTQSIDTSTSQDQQVDTTKVNDSSVSTNEGTQSTKSDKTESASTHSVSDADKEVLISYLDSSYKKYELESICNEVGVEFSGSKYEIITKIVESNPQYIMKLMNS